MRAPRPGGRAGRWLPHGLGTGFRFQLVALRGEADTYFSLVASPFYVVIFLSVMEYSGRRDLYAHAVIAPMLMTLWSAALMFSGEMISQDRDNGRVEALVATTVSFPLLVLGRLLACMVLALPSFGLALLAAGGIFGYWIEIARPFLFAVTLLLAAFGTAATATALSALFVVAPGARIVQNSLSFPMFLLGGVIIPVSSFPDQLEPLTRLIYLSWASDLLRDATDGTATGVLPRLAAVAALSATTLAFGLVFITRFLRRARADGLLAKE
ncbi:ABC transporter permease [Streptomyces sp. NPDC047973]|uniref:ABC transporter permease n=1 Tax=unclassified Streptomyces TaxID=2593676 RepID=UPI0034180827